MLPVWRWRLALAFVVVVALVRPTVIAGQSSPPGAELRLAFDAERVRVLGVAPGAPVALVSIGRRWNDAGPSVRVVERWLEDEDGDGVVVLALTEGVPPRSVWAAVDLTSGAFAVAIPGGDVVTAPRLDASRAITTGAVETVRALSSRAWIWWLRPSKQGKERGAFGGIVADGRAQVTLAELEPFGASGAVPAATRSGDVIVWIDWASLEHFAVRVSS